jgi:hypothetical protein
MWLTVGALVVVLGLDQRRFAAPVHLVEDLPRRGVGLGVVPEQCKRGLGVHQMGCLVRTGSGIEPVPGLRCSDQVETAAAVVPALEVADLDLNAVSVSDGGHLRIDLHPEHRQPALEEHRRCFAGPATNVKHGPRTKRGQYVDQFRRVTRPVPVVLLSNQTE